MISFYLQEILLVLDGTTGLNMLPQAREFNEVLFPSLPFACDCFFLRQYNVYVNI
jgi:signal recognition particle GTPase